MYLYKMVFTKDGAREAVGDIGKMNCMHFIDMNKDEQSWNLPYTLLIKRCEETERRLQ